MTVRAGTAGAGRRHRVRGRGHRRHPGRWHRHRRGRVQHRAVRLPGGHHRPVLRRPDHHLHLPPHRQLRRHRRRRRGPPARSAGAWSSASWPAAVSNWRSDGDLDAFLRAPRRARHRRHRHPPPHPPHPRRRRHARRLRHRPTPTARRRRGRLRPRRPSRAPTASTWSPRSPRAEPYTVGDGARAGSSPTTSASRRTILRHLGEHRHRRGRARRRPSAAEVLARRPDGVFLSNGPGDPAASPTRSTPSRGLLGEVPVFGICLGHQLLARPLGGRHVQAARSATTAATTRCATSRTGAVEITSQNHNFAVDADGARAAAEVTHVNLNDGVIEGFARAPTCRPSSVQHHPEAGPGPHDAALPLRRLRRR